MSDFNKIALFQGFSFSFALYVETQATIGSNRRNNIEIEMEGNETKKKKNTNKEISRNVK